MAKYSKTLQLIASKLGVSEDNKVLSKAAEYERLLQVKSTANTNITDTAKVVICLDLAAGFFGSDLDLKTAIKYSGLKSSVYKNSKKVVENLLELHSDVLTSSLLCAALQCSEVQELADKILEGYQKKARMAVDVNLPQYVCMAVYQACRINKVKISKSKIIEKSRLKPAQWTKFEAEWTKFVDENFATAMKKKGRPSKNATDEGEIEEKIAKLTLKTEDKNTEPEIEPFEDWKRRLLSETDTHCINSNKLGKIGHERTLQKQMYRNYSYLLVEPVSNKRKKLDKDSTKQGYTSQKEIDRKSPWQSLSQTSKSLEPYKDIIESIERISLPRSPRKSPVESIEAISLRRSPRKAPIESIERISLLRSPRKSPVESIETSLRRSPRKSPVESIERISLLRSPRKSPVESIETSLRRSPRKSPVESIERISLPRSPRKSPVESIEAISLRRSPRKAPIESIERISLLRSPRKSPVESIETSLRRSPRKSPQKFEPYISPKKNKVFKLSYKIREFNNNDF